MPRSPRDPSGNSHSYCPWKVMKNHLVGFFLNVKILSRSSGGCSTSFNPSTGVGGGQGQVDPCELKPA